MADPILSDLLWKAAIEDFFDAFLAYFFPQEVDLVDFSRPFEFLDQELAQLMHDHAEISRRVDKLVKVWLKDGHEQWFLVHVEAQGYDDETFARRMFTSYYRILDKYNRNVTAVVIYTNPSRKHQPRQFFQRWMGTTVVYQFHSLSLTRAKFAELSRDNNPFGVVLQAAWGMTRTKSLPELSLHELKMGMYRKLRETDMPRQRIRRLIYFLSQFIHLTSAEYNRIFEAVVEEVFPKQRPTMGIIETVHAYYIQQGLEKGQDAKEREVVTRLIRAGFADAEVVDYSGASLTLVQQMRRELAEAGE